MHKGDKRSARRQPVRYTAWIAPKPGDFHGCVLCDVSDTGARIKVEDSDKIPDHFMLLLAKNAKARRPCHVVWRKPKELGVHFETMPEKSGTESVVASPTLAPIAEASDEPAPAEKA